LNHCEIQIGERRAGKAVTPDISGRSGDGGREQRATATGGVVAAENIGRGLIVGRNVCDARRKVRTVSEMVLTTLVKRSASKNGKWEAGTVVEDSRGVPAADHMTQDAVETTKPATTRAERQFVDIRGNNAMSDVKG